MASAPGRDPRGRIAVGQSGSSRGAPPPRPVGSGLSGETGFSTFWSFLGQLTPRLLPLDRILVATLENPLSVRVHTVDGSFAEERKSDRTTFSPKLWPEPCPNERLGEEALDTDYLEDRALRDAGLRSFLRGSLRGDKGEVGAFWFASRRPDAFTPEHESAVLPIVGLLGFALERDRLSRVSEDRLRRTTLLDALLPTLAQALDVRDVFRQISAVAQQVLPHDIVTLGLFVGDGSMMQLHARSDGQVVEERTPPAQLADELRPLLTEVVIAREVEVKPGSPWIRARLLDSNGERWFDMRPGPNVLRLHVEEGMQSVMHVPVRLDDRVIAGLLFFSRRKEVYSGEDVHLGRRIGDCIALALAHERLAEEKRRATRLEARVARLTDELVSKGGARQPIGAAKTWLAVLAQARKVAATEATVLLTGESGTGKEVMARFIHESSPRANGPFVALNCAALPEQLLESELFGHERGAFTGAITSRPGRIEQAAGGLFFLDEVGEMSPAVQAKFLRVLQEREFQRLGGAKALRADVRVVAATNRNIAEAMSRGQFREDLYYRLHVFELNLPPLRERPDDIVLLLEHFLKEIGVAMGRPAAGISREVRERLLAYHWPGNVRELRNALERAMILCEGGLITSEHLPMALGKAASPAAPPVEAKLESSFSAGLPAEGVDLEAIERDLVQKALKQAGDNKSKAAKLLGLTRAQLYSRIEKYGL